MKSIWNLLRSLDWRVLFAVPALSVLLGAAFVSVVRNKFAEPSAKPPK